MNGVHPIQLERSGDGLCIVWSDGLRQQISARTMRDVCQCASCMQTIRSKAELPAGTLPVLSFAETAPLEIVAMKPVGNYGYNIQFNDGHITGIYTLELLRQIGTSN